MKKPMVAPVRMEIDGELDEYYRIEGFAEYAGYSRQYIKDVLADNDRGPDLSEYVVHIGDVPFIRFDAVTEFRNDDR